MLESLKGNKNWLKVICAKKAENLFRELQQNKKAYNQLQYIYKNSTYSYSFTTNSNKKYFCSHAGLPINIVNSVHDLLTLDKLANKEGKYSLFITEKNGLLKRKTNIIFICGHIPVQVYNKNELITKPFLNKSKNFIGIDFGAAKDDGFLGKILIDDENNDKRTYKIVPALL